MKPEFVEGCPCKDCTGNGIGWIKHKTKAQVKAYLWRKQKTAHAIMMADHSPERPY